MSEHLENIRRTADRGIDTFQHILDELERHKAEPSIPISKLQELEAEWRENIRRTIKSIAETESTEDDFTIGQLAGDRVRQQRCADQLAALIKENNNED